MKELDAGHMARIEGGNASCIGGAVVGAVGMVGATLFLLGGPITAGVAAGFLFGKVVATGSIGVGCLLS